MRRLGKQRVEAKQILDILFGASTNKTRWHNHPAVKMWQGHIPALQAYYNHILDEWIRRGYNNSMEFEYWAPNDLAYKIWQDNIITPEWITPEFCLSHQSNLIRKLPEYYRPIFGEDVPDNLPYIWKI